MAKFISLPSFVELRPASVIGKAALIYRNCLCLYHENMFAFKNSW